MAQTIELQDALHGRAVTLGDLDKCFAAFYAVMNHLGWRTSRR